MLVNGMCDHVNLIHDAEKTKQGKIKICRWGEESRNMQPYIWELPAAGYTEVLDALQGHGLQVEQVKGNSGKNDLWFRVSRASARQTVMIDSSPEPIGEVYAFYSLTWPWRWPAESRLFEEVCRTFDECFKRVM